MREADLETLRSVYQAVSAGDWDAAFRDAHPDFELTTPELSPMAGTYRGEAAVRSFFDDLWSAFDEVDNKVEEVIDLGDRALFFLVVLLRPKDSQARVELRVAHIWTMQDGQIKACRVFTDREQALEASRSAETEAARSLKHAANVPGER
jgi:ketosteroid isomerase-like protein